jgi:hypothetical protein
MATESQGRFQAIPIPPRPLGSHTSILFLHPGYRPPLNILLSLPRVDRSADSAAPFGVHHRTALLACQIIADNAFDTGYLSVDKEGQQRVAVELEGVLTGDAYYFTLGAASSGMSFFSLYSAFSLTFFFV